MIESIGGFHFSSNFDSGNLAKVVKVERSENEFNLWTQPDCANTEYENGNRTWFYFNVQGPTNAAVKFNLMNLNRQAKLYSQGMKPMYRILPHQPQWDRIKERPIHSMDDHTFILSFRFTMPSDSNSTVSFAFCYPYSYTELQEELADLDNRFASKECNIYYQRELLCHSLENRRVDVVTVTSRGDENLPEKPVVFISARVHPGETPSSFVLKGFLDFVLKENDIRAQKLREKFVFKIVPMLNPDGCYRGHYRTDSRGVNLNRVYLETRPEDHPTIAATKRLILSLTTEESPPLSAAQDSLSVLNLEHQVQKNLSMIASTDDSSCCQDDSDTHWPNSFPIADGPRRTNFSGLKFDTSLCSDMLDSSVVESAEDADVSQQFFQDGSPMGSTSELPKKTRLFAYIDLHGHASKRGIFIYGNHFKDAKQQVECLLLPKLVSLNSQHFDFWACNFTERNMYLKDKRDGLSKEGSGRVAVFKLTGIVPSYTLECNYNMGRMRNVLSPLPVEKYPLFHATTNTEDAKDEIDRYEEPLNRRRRAVSTGSGITETFLPATPYTEQSFHEVGEALAVSLLDMIGANPLSRLSQSVYGDVEGVRQWIRYHCLNQKRFQLVEADGDDASASSHMVSTPLTDRLQQVDSPCPSESGFADGASKTTTTLLVTTPPRFVFSPAKKDSPPPGASSHSSKAKDRDQSSTSTTMNSTSRVRVPWPGSRHKESPNQHHYLTSPRGSTATAVSQLDSVTEFLEAAIHFPKQQKSPSTLRRVPRKKTLRKSKVVLKKEAAPESTDLLERIDLGLNAPSSPPKTLLKRKRRKSRNSSSSSSVENAKEKREMKAVAVEELTVASDDPMPSTSATLSPPLVSTLLRSPLVKKKKLIRLKKTSLVLKKKRATE